VTAAAAPFSRLDGAVRRAVSAGEIGAARSIRLHVGAPADDRPDLEAMLGLGDSIFDCARVRVERVGEVSSWAVLCAWEHGQIATVSSALSPRAILLLTVLGSAGALHFQQG
jgi:hypothetical protein